MLLPVAPDVFHRIQFGGVGGKILDMDSAAELVDIVAHETAAVGRQAVPHQKQWLANVLHERLQKIDDLRTLDRTSVQPEIETQERESSNRSFSFRETLMASILSSDPPLQLFAEKKTAADAGPVPSFSGRPFTMGGALASVFGLGQSLLRPATRQRQAAQHGPEGSGFQVDPHSVSLLSHGAKTARETS